MMKYFLILLFILALSYFCFAETVPLESVNVAGNSTNSTAGTVYDFNESMSQGFRIYISAIANAGTTNGNLIVKFKTSPDGVTFDTPNASTNSGVIQVTFKASGTSINSGTNIVSEWFSGYGIRAIRVDSRENTCPGSWSNVTPTVVYRKQ